MCPRSFPNARNGDIESHVQLLVDCLNSEASDGPLPFPAKRYLEVAFVHYRALIEGKTPSKGDSEQIEEEERCSNQKRTLQILVADAKPLTLEN
jgi:hypothetical protein